MLSLTYGQIRNPQFIEAFSRLHNSPMHTKVAYVMTKVARAIQEESKDMDAVWKKLVEEFAIKDEKGQVVPNEQGQVQLVQERLEEFRTRAEEFHRITFDGKGRCIQVDELDGIKLSPSDLAALEGLIVE